MPVFVMVFAATCGACKRFKETNLNEVRAALTAYPGLTTFEYNVPSVGAPLPLEAPKDLGNFVKFYPCFLLIPNNIWNLAKKGSKLSNVLLYGATVSPENKIILLPTTEATKDSLTEWIRNNIDHDANFKNDEPICADHKDLKDLIMNSKGKLIPTEGSVCSFKILSKR